MVIYISETGKMHDIFRGLLGTEEAKGRLELLEIKPLDCGEMESVLGIISDKIDLTADWRLLIVDARKWGCSMQHRCAYRANCAFDHNPLNAYNDDWKLFLRVLTGEISHDSFHAGRPKEAFLLIKRGPGEENLCFPPEDDICWDGMPYHIRYFMLDDPTRGRNGQELQELQMVLAILLVVFGVFFMEEYQEHRFYRLSLLLEDKELTRYCTEMSRQYRGMALDLERKSDALDKISSWYSLDEIYKYESIRDQLEKEMDTTEREGSKKTIAQYIDILENRKTEQEKNATEFFRAIRQYRWLETVGRERKKKFEEGDEKIAEQMKEVVQLLYKQYMVGITEYDEEIKELKERIEKSRTYGQYRAALINVLTKVTIIMLVTFLGTVRGWNRVEVFLFMLLGWGVLLGVRWIFTHLWNLDVRYSMEQIGRKQDCIRWQICSRFDEMNRYLEYTQIYRYAMRSRKKAEQKKKEIQQKKTMLKEAEERVSYIRRLASTQEEVMAADSDLVEYREEFLTYPKCWQHRTDMEISGKKICFPFSFIRKVDISNG